MKTVIAPTVYAKINDIYREYCGRRTTQEELNSWIKLCITQSILDAEELKTTFNYEEAHIEYFKSLKLFSVIKSEHEFDGSLKGITYDISICLKPYLLTFFGTDHLGVLKEAIHSLEDEVDDLSKQISDDIDTWCKNVECVFNAIESTT